MQAWKAFDNFSAREIKEIFNGSGWAFDTMMASHDHQAMLR